MNTGFNKVQKYSCNEFQEFEKILKSNTSGEIQQKKIEEVYFKKLCSSYTSYQHLPGIIQKVVLPKIIEYQKILNKKRTKTLVEKIFLQARPMDICCTMYYTFGEVFPASNPKVSGFGKKKNSKLRFLCYQI